MKPYRFMYGAVPWPAGLTTLQVYAPVDLRLNTELGGLIEQWRAALSGAPITLVEDRWLHVTLVISSCQAKRQARQLVSCQAR